MAQELQSLLDRFQKDGVEKADAEAQRIVEDAKSKAETIVKDAEEQAAAALKQAEKDGKAFEDRGRAALEQAARDVVITVKDAVTRALRAVVQHEVRAAMTPDNVAAMLAELVKAYAKAGAGAGGIEILLPEDQKQAVADTMLARFQDAMREGVTLKGDGRVVAGFRVALVDDNVEHDFTEEAVTAALCELLRPHIAGILKQATAKAD